MSRKVCVFASDDTAFAEKLINMGMDIQLFPIAKSISKFKTIKFPYTLFAENSNISTVSMVYADLDKYAFDHNLLSLVR